MLKLCIDRLHSLTMHRVIHKSLRNFRTRLRNNEDRHSRVDISSNCKVGQKLGVSLPLLTCSPWAYPTRLLYSRGQKSRRDLRITLYLRNKTETPQLKKSKAWCLSDGTTTNPVPALCSCPLQQWACWDRSQILQNTILHYDWRLSHDFCQLSLDVYFLSDSILPCLASFFSTVISSVTWLRVVW